MRVLLIQPPYPFSEFPKPSSALMGLGAVLRQEGIEVQVLDLLSTRFTPAKIEARLHAFQPQVIGITAVTMNFPQAIRILNHCKQVAPESITLMGGPHATFTAREVLQDFPAVDMVVRGEGEETIRELVRSLDGGKDLGMVRGLSLRRDGNIVQTDPRPLIQDLSALPPPDRTLFPLSRYLAMRVPASVLSSRGCPVGCTFCAGSRLMGRPGRFRDPLRVVDEMESALRLGFEEICVDDDLFSRRPSHVRAICDEIGRRRLRFRMYIFARVDTVDRDLLERLKEAGCAMICFGLESGSQDILDRANKRATIESARRAVRLCQEVGIVPFGSFILGLPGETRKTMEESLSFARSLEIPFGFHLLAPFPGTPIRERAADYGIKILTDDWSLYDADHAVTESAALPAVEVEQFARKFFQDLEEKVLTLRNGTLRGTYHGPFRKEMEKRIEVDMAWRMLSGDLVEEHGRFPARAAQMPDGGEDPMVPLARRIAKRLPYPESRVLSQLGSFSARGLIVGHKTPLHYQWQWREDPPPADPLPGECSGGK